MVKTLKQIIAGFGAAGALALGGCTPGDFVGLGNMATQMEANDIQRERNGIYNGQNTPRQYVLDTPTNKKPWWETIPQVPMEKDLIFACVSSEDKNGDGLSLDEFRGFKQTVFRKGETVEFCIYNTAERGDLRFVLKDAGGKIIRDVTENYSGGLAVTRDPPYKLNAGKYTAEWYRNEILLGRTEIEYKE